MLSLTLLAQLPELGQLNRREIAKLVGVAPLTGIAGGGVVHATSGADARPFVHHSSWPLFALSASTRPLSASING